MRWLFPFCAAVFGSSNGSAGDGRVVVRQSDGQVEQYIQQVNAARYAVSIVEAGNATAVCGSPDLPTQWDRDSIDEVLAEQLICEAAIGIVVFPDLTKAATDLETTFDALESLQQTQRSDLDAQSCASFDTSTLDDAGLDGEKIRELVCLAATATAAVLTSTAVASSMGGTIVGNSSALTPTSPTLPPAVTSSNSSSNASTGSILTSALPSTSSPVILSTISVFTPPSLTSDPVGFATSSISGLPSLPSLPSALSLANASTSPTTFSQTPIFSDLTSPTAFLTGQEDSSALTSTSLVVTSLPLPILGPNTVASNTTSPTSATPLTMAASSPATSAANKTSTAVPTTSSTAPVVTQATITFFETIWVAATKPTTSLNRLSGNTANQTTGTSSQVEISSTVTTLSPPATRSMSVADAGTSTTSTPVQITSTASALGGGSASSAFAAPAQITSTATALSVADVETTTGSLGVGSGSCTWAGSGA